MYLAVTIPKTSQNVSEHKSGGFAMKKNDWNLQQLKMLLNSNCIDSDESLKRKTAVKNITKEND